MKKKIVGIVGIVVVAVVFGALYSDNFPWNDIEITYFDTLSKQTVNKWTNRDNLYQINYNPSYVTIVVNETIMPRISVSLEQYAAVLTEEGIIVKITDDKNLKTPQQLREYLKKEYKENNLEGALLVGDLPVVQINRKIRKEGKWYDEYFPTDLYYTDMNGTWKAENISVFSDFNISTKEGKYNRGITKKNRPEIWLGRITPSPFVKENLTGQVCLINSYFEKNLAYRRGDLPREGIFSYYNSIKLNRSGFNISEDFQSKTSVSEGNISFLIEPSPMNKSYYKEILSQNYEWVHLATHSSSKKHCFGEERFYSSELKGVVANSLFYVLECCKATRYTDDNNIGGMYLFSRNSSGLAVIGYTRSQGTFNEISVLFSSVGEGKSLGESYKLFQESVPLNRSVAGLVFLGDPTLVPHPRV